MCMDTQCHTVCGFWQAVDADEQRSVTYTMVEGNTEQFALDERSGALKTRNGLDFEQRQEYTLTISTREATDAGQSGELYRTTVQVMVLVCNFLIE